MWSGEGGFLLTNNTALAARCRAFRSHWRTPSSGTNPLAELGRNYRLAEPLAAIARTNLARLDDLLAQRQRQSDLLTSAVIDTPGFSTYEQRPWDDLNGYAPLLRIDLDRPRQFCEHLAHCGVPNSIGNYGLMAADRRPLFARTPVRRVPTQASCWIAHWPSSG